MLVVLLLDGTNTQYYEIVIFKEIQGVFLSNHAKIGHSTNCK